MKYRSLIVLLLLPLSACVGNYYQLATPEYDMKKYEEVGTDTEIATGVHLFGFIPIMLNNKIERASEALLKEHGGTALTNVEVQERWWWAYVLNLYQVKVRGTVLREKE